MPLLNEPEPVPRSSGRGWLYILVAVALAAGAGYYLYTSGILTPSEDADRRAAVDAPAPVRPAPAAPAATEPRTDRGAGSGARTGTRTRAGARGPNRPRRPRPPSCCASPATWTAREVFIDRRYAGTTPFESYEVEPGRHRINVSAPGYEGHAEDVEITAELTAVDVRFRQNPAGPAHPGRPQAPFRPTARATSWPRRAGSPTRPTTTTRSRCAWTDSRSSRSTTWRTTCGSRCGADGPTNFTDGEENADTLFVFHRAVEEARGRLARGESPAAP